jgi:hypothetical protein
VGIFVQHSIPVELERRKPFWTCQTMFSDACYDEAPSQNWREVMSTLVRERQGSDRRPPGITW